MLKEASLVLRVCPSVFLHLRCGSLFGAGGGGCCAQATFLRCFSLGV